jgi:hypothetical protein
MIRMTILLLLFFINLPGQAQSVYKTPSGQKYHLETCKMVKNVSQKITVQEAADLGLDPCKICRPDVLPVQQNLTNKAKGENKTAQCKGYTKSGTRCRHMTSIADGYCFQHRPD